LCACSSGRRPGPQEVFDHIHLTFVHGDLLSARNQADQAYQQFSRDSPAWAWKFRLLKANVLAWQGLNRDVLSTLESELPLDLASGDLAIEKQMLQGLAFARLGRFPEADRSVGEAERRCDLSHCVLNGEVARVRGVVEVERGDLGQAEEFFRKSLQIAGQRQHPDDFLQGTDLLNLGVVAMKQEHYDQSIDWSNAADKIFKTLDARLNEERILGNLGWAYYKMGDFDESLALYQEAEARARGLGGLMDQVRWLTTIGDVYADTNQPSEAEDQYRKALGLAQQIQNSEEIVDAEISLAFVSVQTGKLDLAKQYSEQARGLGRALGDRLDELYPLLAEGEAAALSGNSGEAEHAFLEVVRDPRSDTSLRWEAEDELAKLYADEHRTEEAGKQYRTALATFEGARSSLQREESKLPFLTNANHLYDDYLHFLLGQGKTVEALQLADYSRAQTLAEGLGLLQGSATLRAAVSPRQIARHAGGTILFYWLGPKQSYLWAVTQGQVSLFQLPPASEIDAAVQGYRKALLGPRDVLQTANPEGSKLFDILVRPARQAIGPNSRVVIIPDGSLNNLNFETLLVAEPKLHYWIEDVTVMSASSLRLLAASHNSPREPSKTGAGELLLIGDAVAANPQYGELSKASVEIANVEKHFTAGGRRVYTRAQATAPAYLESAPEQFTYIHFVAHGTASRLSPLDSAVILSRASAGEDSFKLYARDIIRHPLHADLVTISTCYGAGARAYTGEGLVGLSWAFLRAGAHNVVGALWEVSDASTPRLMDQLYGELQKGRSPEAALRSAKLSLLHSDDVFRKPFYWAPFQLYTGS